MTIVNVMLPIILNTLALLQFIDKSGYIALIQKFEFFRMIQIFELVAFYKAFRL